MLTRLVRQFGVALLAVSLIAAPVLGAMPRCCKTGAIAGGGSCCCGPRTETEELPACCQETQRSCCAEAGKTTTTDSVANESPRATDAPCSCKTISLEPAIVTGKDQVETHQKHSSVIAVARFCGTASQLAVAGAWVTHQVEPPDIALHKIYCRWTV